jgi:hypothetical protein
MKLVFIEGVFSGRQEMLKPVGSVIGRISTADIHLDDQGISRQHCRISRVEGQWLIEDLGSINGVQVNGVRVQGAQALQPADRIAILNNVMVFADDNVPTAMPAGEMLPRPEPVVRPAETSIPARVPFTDPPVNVPPAIAASPGAIPEPPEPHAAPLLSLPRRPPPPLPPLQPSATGMPRPANATVGHTPPPRPLPIPAAPPPQISHPVRQDSTSLAPVQTVEPPSNDDSRSQLWMRMVLIVVILALAALLVVVLKQPQTSSGINPPGRSTVNVLPTPEGSANSSTVPVTDQVLLVPIPENGEILLEGTQPIMSPALVPGKGCTVVIRKPGYKDLQIQMGTGKMPPLVFEPKPPSVLITSVPTGAAVYKGGQFLGRTPCIISNLADGSHLLTVGGQDTRPSPLTITVSRRSSNAVYHVPLTKMPVNP